MMRYNGVMERMQRDFKGVWIPSEIWLSEKLSLIEKVLFVEIYYLDNERGCRIGTSASSAQRGSGDDRVPRKWPISDAHAIN